MDLLQKNMIIDEIHRVSPIFQRRSDVQYSIRCPFCGDSDKEPTHTHFYIKCSKDESEPLLYNCFLCPHHGVVNSHVLKKIGVTNKKILALVDNCHYNKFSKDEDTKLKFDNFGNIMDGNIQIKYIESRLGPGLNKDDYNRFRVLWNIENIAEVIQNQNVKNSLPSNRESITFLTDDCTMLLTRTFDEGSGNWRKIRIRNTETRAFYTIQTTLNLFTKDPIVINIAEGIFDVLSIYKNFNDVKDSVFIATLGSDYVSALEYAMRKGLIGKNVQVRIYIDKGIDERSLKFDLQKYKWIFDSITVLKNAIGKDVGVKPEKIKLISNKI